MPGSQASSVSSYSEHNGGEGEAGLHPGGEEEFMEEPRAWQAGVFGVLYTVSKEKDNHTVLFAAFRLFMDWLQLFLLTVGPAYGFDINDKNLAWRIFNFIQLNQFMAARGVSFFLGCLYVLVAALLANIAISVWVAWSFQNNRFDYVWPIKFLRYFATIFYQVLDIASMTLFLMTLDCNYFGQPEGVKFYNQEFPDVYCWSMPHLIHVVVSVFSLIVFVIMAGLFTMAEMELNPITKNLMAMGHSRCELVGFAIKVIMTCSSVFITSGKWCSAVQLIMAGLLTFLYLRWVPHYSNLVNHVRVGTYASIIFSALMWVILAFDLGVKDPDNPEEVHNMSKRISIITWVGVVPAAALGWLASWMRIRHFHVTVLDRFRNMSPDDKPKEVCTVTDARHVEILSRCCRTWVAIDTLDKEAVSLASQVMKCGLHQLPKDPYMIIIYSSFLIDVELSYQSGYKLLQTAKKADPSVLERFAIFSREQQHTQKSASGGGGQTVDLVSFVELQRNYGLAMKVHKEALLAARAFWTCLLHHNIKIRSLTKAIKRMDKANKQAERVYRQVLQRHANNVKMVRLYAKFLVGVKHDPWNAAKWINEAEKLEAAEDLAKANNMLEGMDADPALRAALMSDQWQAHGIIIMSAQSSIQMANQAAQDILGYGKGELRGKSVSCIIPSPIAEHHPAYVQRNIDSGKQMSIFTDRWNAMMVLHKERHLVPINMKVTKVSGIGEDTVFMGMFKAAPPPRETACMWLLPNGNIISADHQFFDWFGYKATDISTMGLDILLQEYAEVQDMLSDVQVAAATEMDAALGIAENQAPNAPQRASPSFLASQFNGPQLLQVFRARASQDAPMSAGPRTTLSGNEMPTLAPNSTERSSNYGRRELPSCHVLHKFLDMVEVDVTLSYAGIGSQHLYKLQLRRTGPLQVPYLMVADSKGRIIHVTDKLLRLLGSTRTAFLAAVPPGQSAAAAAASVAAGGIAAVAALAMADAAKQQAPGIQLEQMMLEPFASLHKHAGPSTNPHFHSSLSVPPYSCRSGLSVLMPCNTRRGPDATPVRMSIQRRGTAEGVYHVMSLEPRTLEQACDERCLRLVVDCLGVVQEASSGTPKSLFGLEPRRLVGRSLSSFVDVFQQGGEDDDLGINDDAIDLLVDLVKHAKQFPGAAFNVGVVAPPPKSSSRLPESVQPLLQSQRTRAAIMTVELKLDLVEDVVPYPGVVHPPKAGHGSSHLSGPPRSTHPFQTQASKVGAPAPRGSSQQPDFARQQTEEDSLSALFSQEVPGANSRPQVSMVGNIGSDHNMLGGKSQRGSDGLALPGLDRADVQTPEPEPRLEIRLYRADLITSVVEVDAAGRVSFLPDRSDAFTQLYNGGLVFGNMDAAMLGHHLNRYLHLNGNLVSDLFEHIAPPKGMEVSNGGDDDPVSKIKSTMKVRSTGVKPVGPANILRTRQVGGLPLELPVTVQAVRKVWPATGTYLVIHPHDWPCGRPDFLAWLRANSTALGGGKQRTSHSGTSLVPLLTQMSMRSARAAAGMHPRSMGSVYGMDGVPRSGRVWSKPVLSAQPSLNARHAALEPAALDTAAAGEDGASGAIPLPAMDMQGGLPPVAESPPPMSGLDMVDGKGVRSKQDSDEMMRQGADGGCKDGSPLGSLRHGQPSPPPPGMDEEAEKAAAQKKMAGREDLIAAWVLANGPQYLPSARGTPDGTGTDAVPAVSMDSALVVPRQGSILANGRQSMRVLGAISGKGLRMDPAVVVFGDEEEGGVDWQQPKGKFGQQLEGPMGMAGPPAEDDDMLQPPPELDTSGDESGDIVRATTLKKQAARRGGSDKDTEDEGLTDAEGFTGENHFKRGRRYKKLLRIMSTSLVQMRLSRFKLHTVLIVLALLAVHAGMFIMMYFLIKKQLQMMQTLYYISQSVDAASDVAVHTRQLNAIYSRELYPNLIGMSDVSDLQPTLDLYMGAIDYFREMHSGAYLGYNNSNMPLPDTNSVRHMWEFPEFNETTFWHADIGAAGSALNGSASPVANVVMSHSRGASLWDVGNRYLGHAYNFLLNSPRLYNGTYPQADAKIDVDLLYIETNYRNCIIHGYLDTMDGMVQYIIDNANEVNRTQVIILILEGVCLCLVAVAYVWYLASKVSSERFKLYSIFLAVPQGIVRALATRKLDLDADEDEDEEEHRPVTQENEGDGGGDGGAGVTLSKAPAAFGRRASLDMPKMKLAIGSKSMSASLAQEENSGLWAGLKAVLCCWRGRSATVVPGGKKGKKPKRTLLSSSMHAFWQTVLFMLWGALVIATNGIGVGMLTTINGPVATLIILNFCMVVYNRNVHYMQEMVFQPSDPVRQAALRADYVESMAEMKKEYNVLLFGSKVVPNETDPHYTLVKDGLLFTDSHVTHYLFNTNECLLQDADPGSCLPEDHPLYKWTVGGLDRMMQHAFELADTVPDMTDLEPAMNSTVFDYMWNLNNHVGGGFDLVDRVYYDYVVGVYNKVLSVHVAALVITILIYIAFLTLLMRPFAKEVTSETPRIAELLIELPSEIDVEGLLLRSIKEGMPSEGS